MSLKVGAESQSQAVEIFITSKGALSELSQLLGACEKAPPELISDMSREALVPVRVMDRQDAFPVNYNESTDMMCRLARVYSQLAKNPCCGVRRELHLGLLMVKVLVRERWTKTLEAHQPDHRDHWRRECQEETTP